MLKKFSDIKTGDKVIIDGVIRTVFKSEKFSDCIRISLEREVPDGIHSFPSAIAAYLGSTVETP